MGVDLAIDGEKSGSLQAIAIFFYSNVIPFNVARSVEFPIMWSRI